ncbi:MAG: hypothetical protein IKM47_08695 [Bacteroidaceae bacterium]|nr:hypothetical protein [Bacteroidaceae bacterium]
MNNRVQTFIIHYSNEIQFRQLPRLRSGVLKAMNYDASVLFHNHKSEKELRYAYPLIQYKRIRGKAAIVCMNEGVNVIGEFLSRGSMAIELDGRDTMLKIENAIPRITTIQAWDDAVFRYNIRRWLPLNSENYVKYCSMESDEERIAFIEKLLTANILSFFKGAGVNLERNIQCSILKLSEPRLLHFKNTKLMAFDALFSSNVTLPDYIGIGRHVSVGFGTVVRERMSN